MKKIFPIILLISVILNIGLIYFFVFKGDVIPLKDHRKAIVMSSDNKNIVLKEMRDFLQSIQQINEGIIENNAEKIIKSATASGRSVEQEIPKGLIKSLPIDFKKMGFGTHDLFDEIADSAKVNFNAKTTHRQLNTLLNRCVACHQIYQIKTSVKK